MLNVVKKLVWLVILPIVAGSAHAQLGGGTIVNIPVAGTEYARGASIYLNDAGLLTFTTENSQIWQGSIPAVSYVFPAAVPAPNGGGTFEAPANTSITPGGSIAALIRASSAPQGVYYISGKTASAMAYLGGSAPGGGIFSDFYTPSANNSGEEAFFATTQGGPGEGIFLGYTGPTPTEAIALYTGAAPGGAGTFTGFNSDVTVTASGKVAFFGFTSGGQGGGIYMGTTAGLSLIPKSSAESTYFVNDSDEVLFQSNGGLYLGNTSASSLIVSTGATAPCGGTFGTISYAILNDAGQVAFSAYIEGATVSQGIFLWTPSGIKSIALAGLAPGGGTFNLSSLAEAVPVLNNKGQVAFTAATSSGTRLFIGDGTSLIKVLGAGDIVSGYAVQNVVLPSAMGGGSGQGPFNDLGQLAFDAVFEGSQGFFDELMVMKETANADFNNAGHPDLVLQNASTHQIAVWFLSGTNGTKIASSAFLSPPLLSDTNAQVVGVADLNRDGYQDMVWQDYANGKVGVTYLGGAKGTTVSSTAAILQIGPNWHVDGVADFNNDGHADLVFQNIVTHQIYIYLLGGTNGAQLASGKLLSPALLSDTNAQIVGVADLNRDGHQDLLWQDYTNGKIGVAYLNGTTISGEATIGLVGGNWRIEGAGDLNNDDHQDLIFQNISTQQAEVMYLGGANGVTDTGISVIGTLPARWLIRNR